MSKKRKTKADLEAELAAAEDSTKKHKSSINSAAKEFVCPISLDLPVEPVTASDGRVYNRADIQRHIDTAKKEGKEILSPVTKEKLEEKLLPAVQVTNTIRSLIESGAVDGELANQWKKVDKMKKEAEKGDAYAMTFLGASYYGAMHGFVKDYERAYQWYEKAAGFGNISAIHAMAWQGLMLLMGQGITKDIIYGTSLLTMAGDRGSELGSFMLGRGYFKGVNGFPKNSKMVKFWLEKSAELSSNHRQSWLGPGDAKQLKKLLVELEKYCRHR